MTGTSEHIGAGPAGYPDYQRQLNANGSIIRTFRGHEVVGLERFGPYPTSSFAGVMMVGHTIAELHNIYIEFAWLAEGTEGTPFARKELYLEGEHSVPYALHFPVLGPSMTLELSSTRALLDLALYGTAALPTVESYPLTSPVVNTFFLCKKGEPTFFYSQCYTSGPAELFVETTKESSILRLEVYRAGWERFYQATLGPEEQYRAKVILPLGFTRVSIENTSPLVAEQKVFVSLTPGPSGSS